MAFPKKAFVEDTRDVAVRVVPVAFVKLRLVEVTPVNCGDDVAHKFCDNPNVTTPGEEVEIVTLFAGMKVYSAVDKPFIVVVVPPTEFQSAVPAFHKKRLLLAVS